ncbi:hypothetical protein [Desemzia sp. FAM 23991]|uniref:hypothetical protein n=1 Tax=unclassified Desemzia TaxID=2685243 RepID=UPI00388468B4
MTKNKSEKKKSQWSTVILVMGGSAIIGLTIGFVAGVFLETDAIELNLSLLFIGFIAFFISYLIHILLHEMGHLVFGLMTGYAYVSFRIGSLTLVKEEGSIQQKRMNLPGTGGQCLMSPPAYNEGDFPFVLYNLGGVLMNAVLSIALFGLIFNGVFSPPILMTILSAFALAGLFTAATNGIPMKMGGIPNDGYNLYLLLKNQENKYAFYTQLKINALMTQGKRVKDIPLTTLQLEGEKDYSNPLKVAMYLLEYNWYIDQLKFEEARLCLTAFDPYIEEMSVLYKNELTCERLFLELIQDADPFVVKKFYTKELQKYIKMTTYLPNKKRLMMAYEAFHQRNYPKAMEYYNELQKTATIYPVKGESAMERILGEWIKEKMSFLTMADEKKEYDS